MNASESITATCKYCGDALPPHCRLRCRKPECKRAYNAERARRWNAEHPGYRQRFASNTDIYPHICERCSVEFKSHKQVQRYCSVECLRLARAARRRAAVERERQRLLPVLHPNPDPTLARYQLRLSRRQPTSGPNHRFIGGRCARCGENFVMREQGGHAYCSNACASLAAKARRRAKKRGCHCEPIERAAIFDRDGWRCHICGRKINRRLHNSHPMGPTLDHIVPIDDGGADAAWNLAPAHRRCNSRKGTRGGGQLLLMLS